jgi:glycosyltransferase involved in cell wall biosynthesis
MAGARMLVMASIWYGGFLLVLIEALAAGTPCLVPRLGGLPDIIPDGILGRTFDPDDPSDLARQALRLWDEAPAMRSPCRAAYEAHYTPERHLQRLLAIYDNARAGRPPGAGFEAAG